MSPDADADADADSNGQLWMRGRTNPNNPSTSSPNPNPGLRHVTPIRPAHFMYMPYHPHSVRIIPADPDTLEPPVRPSPPSPLNDRMTRWTPVRHAPSPHSLPAAIDPDSMDLDGPETRFESNSATFGSGSTLIPASELPADSTMEYSATTPPFFPHFEAAPTPISNSANLGQPPFETIERPSVAAVWHSNPPTPVGSFIQEYNRTLRARIERRPPTPRPSGWTIDNYDLDGSPVARSDYSPGASPLALTHESMEIDGMFQNTTLDSARRNETTNAWVQAERKRSDEMLRGVEDEDTLVNPPEDNVAGGSAVRFRERRNTLPTGNAFDGQGDRLAPSSGPTGRKRELSGGDGRAGPSKGTPEEEKRKRRKLKGKGKENL